MKFKMILATDNQQGIGANNSLPWPKNKTDMAWFKSITCGSSDNEKNAVVMGYNTWLSLPIKYRPLSHRANIVLTKNHKDDFKYLDDVICLDSFDELIKWSNSSMGKRFNNCFIIGGASIYKNALDYLDIKSIYLTTFNNCYPNCDCFFNVREELSNRQLDFDVIEDIECDELKFEILEVKQRIIS